MQQPQHLPREGDRPAADRREHLHMLNKLGLTLFTAAPNLRPAARSALVIDPSPEDRTYCKVVIIWDDPSTRPVTGEVWATAPQICGLKTLPDGMGSPDAI